MGIIELKSIVDVVASKKLPFSAHKKYSECCINRNWCTWYLTEWQRIVKSLHVSFAKFVHWFNGSSRLGAATSCASCFISERNLSVSVIVHLINSTLSSSILLSDSAIMLLSPTPNEASTTGFVVRHQDDFLVLLITMWVPWRWSKSIFCLCCPNNNKKSSIFDCICAHNSAWTFHSLANCNV